MKRSEYRWRRKDTAVLGGEMIVRIPRGGLTLRKDLENKNVLRDCRNDGRWAEPASPLRDHPGLTYDPLPVCTCAQGPSCLPMVAPRRPGIHLHPLIPPLAPEKECSLLCPGSLSPGPTPPPTAAAHHSLLAPVSQWSLRLLPQGSVLTNIPATLPHPSLTHLSGVPAARDILVPAVHAPLEPTLSFSQTSLPSLAGSGFSSSGVLAGLHMLCPQIFSSAYIFFPG